MQLKHPFDVRRNGETVTLTDLEVPDAVSVAMVINAPSYGVTNLHKAMSLAVACGGLNAADAQKLSVPDALAYLSELSPHLQAKELGFKMPVIRPLASSLRMVTVEADENPAKFAYQVLMACGVDKKTLDVLPFSEFVGCVQEVVDCVFDPK